MKLRRFILFLLPFLIITTACGLTETLAERTLTVPPTPGKTALPTSLVTPAATNSAAPQNTAVIPPTTNPAKSPTLTPLPSDNDHLVKILPVFFVPVGEKEPTPEQGQKLMRHLQWAQQHYLEMLSGQDTFQLAADQPSVYKAKNALSFYRSAAEGGAPQYLSELLDYSKLNRFSARVISLIVVMNPADDFPGGGGRPINGGYNTGGGIIILSSYALDTFPYIQSTLQHELGHSFGLPHVDVYGYSMDNNASIMSYNLAQHTNGFNPAPKPGILIPEDLRGLAYNQKVFPKLTFRPERDIPQGYSIHDDAPVLGPMTIPGQPAWSVKVTTPSGEDFNTLAANVFQHSIKPSSTKAGFDAKSMWHSSKTTTGWVSLEVTFPVAVTLDKMVVHSQHSGQYHAAQQVKIQPYIQDTYQAGSQQILPTTDATVSFPPATAQKWKFSFQSGESGYVVIRGLQLFNGNYEVFPPPAP